MRQQISYISFAWSHLYIDGILSKGPYPPCLRMADRALLAGILSKGPYPPCLRMADRALLAGYPRYILYFLQRFMWFSDRSRPSWHRMPYWRTSGVLKTNGFYLTHTSNGQLTDGLPWQREWSVVTIGKRRENYLGSIENSEDWVAMQLAVE